MIRISFSEGSTWIEINNRRKGLLWNSRQFSTEPHHEKMGRKDWLLTFSTFILYLFSGQGWRFGKRRTKSDLSRPVRALLVHSWRQRRNDWLLWSFILSRHLWPVVHDLEAEGRPLSYWWEPQKPLLRVFLNATHRWRCCTIMLILSHTMCIFVRVDLRVIANDLNKKIF